MTEAITSVAANPVKEGGLPLATNDPGAASSYDIRDFSAAMARNGGAVDTGSATQQTQASQSVEATGSNGMRNLFATLDHLNGSADKVQQLAKMLGAQSEMTPSQVVRMTVASHEFMFQSQLTSNVANRTSDGVQQLFRQQS